MPGVTNGSTLTSPKPIANWARPLRVVLGNTLPKELLRNACWNTPRSAQERRGSSGDDAAGSTSQAIFVHNTWTGWNSTGRCNLFYDEGSTPRTNRLMACAGNIWSQINFKTDTFAADGARVGNWQYEYGAGCQGEFTMFDKASTHAALYKGLRAKHGASNTVCQDQLFLDYRGTDSPDGSAVVAGAGGGDYRLQSGSPAKGLVRPVLKWDLAAQPRSAVLASAGA